MSDRLPKHEVFGKNYKTITTTQNYKYTADNMKRQEHKHLEHKATNTNANNQIDSTAKYVYVFPALI